MEYKESDLEGLQKQLECIDEICTKGPLSRDFETWRINSLLILGSLLGSDSTYVQTFRDISYSSNQENTRAPALVRRKKFESGMLQARAVISNCLETIRSNRCKVSNSKQETIQFIETLCNRFPEVAKRICTKYRGGREIFDINDEYDVQHLFHALLSIKIDDIRPEDVNSSYAGATSRVDFLLKQEKIVIEVKKTRANLKDKEIGEQLIIDMKRYSQNQDCETLICFVYDPEQLISNPYGLERDLNGRHDSLEVKVIISPKT